MKNTVNMIVVVSAVLASIAVFPSHVSADETSGLHYEMVVVGNNASGDLVSRGDYELAINRINSSHNIQPYAAATNLCVAHSMLGEFDQAGPQCDEAINKAEKSPAGAPRNWKGRNQLATLRALAYSNRGVMRMLRGDQIGAEQDFQTAIEHKENLRTPVQNYAKTRIVTTAPAVARVGM